MARTFDDRYDSLGRETKARGLGWKIGVGLAIFLGLLTAWLSYYTVDQGDVGIVKRWGERIAISDPGLHFKVPWIDTVDEIEVRNRKITKEMDSSSSDPMSLPIVVTMNWEVNKKDIGALYDEYGGLTQFEERILIPRFLSGSKTAASRFSVNDLVLNRDKLQTEIGKVLDERMPTNVMGVTGVSVEDVLFPPDYMKQIKDKQIAREAALTEKFTLEQQKYKSQQITQTAVSQANADRAKADAEAYGITKKGNAEIAVIEAKGKAIAANPLIIQYTNASNWSGKLPDTFIGGEQAGNILFNLPSQNGAQRAATTP